jgi:hypothetical protein
MIRICEIIKNSSSKTIKIIVETNDKIIQIPLDPTSTIPYELYIQLRERIESHKCKNSAKIQLYKVLMILDKMAEHSIRKSL